VLQKAKENEVP